MMFTRITRVLILRWWNDARTGLVDKCIEWALWEVHQLLTRLAEFLTGIDWTRVSRRINGLTHGLITTFYVVYSSPEAGLNVNQPHLMNKLAGRKSGSRRPFTKQSKNFLNAYSHIFVNFFLHVYKKLVTHVLCNTNFRFQGNVEWSNEPKSSRADPNPRKW